MLESRKVDLTSTIKDASSIRQYGINLLACLDSYYNICVSLLVSVYTQPVFRQLWILTLDVQVGTE